VSERKPGAVWQGRLAAGLDPRARALNDSLPVDGRLVGEELALSRAYATTLAECGVMTEAERAALTGACDALEADLGAGRAKLAGEDVHSAVESALAERCGDPRCACTPDARATTRSPPCCACTSCDSATPRSRACASWSARW
jgi:argininosuccinate lyase